MKRILVPVDFSPLSKKALQYAIQLSREFGAELKVCHVLEPLTPAPMLDGYMIASIRMVDDDASQERKQLTTLMHSAQGAGVNQVDGTIRRGIAAYEIVEAAKELDVDLIVLATHGYTGWKHFCIGSTAERVVRAAPCPVLVVREKEREFC